MKIFQNSTRRRRSDFFTMGRSGSKESTLTKKLLIFLFLKQHSVEGKLPYGVVQDCASEFGCSRDLVSRIRRITKGVEDEASIISLLKPKTSSRGRKGFTPETLRARIQSVHFNRRRTYWSLSRACGISLSALHRAVKSGRLRRYTGSIKPLLTEKTRRIESSLRYRFYIRLRPTFLLKRCWMSSISTKSGFTSRR